MSGLLLGMDETPFTLSIVYYLRNLTFSVK